MRRMKIKKKSLKKQKDTFFSESGREAATKNPFFIQLQSFTDTILKLTARFSNQISLPTTHENEQALFEKIKNNL